jgi:hypothetical protein
MYSQTNWLGEFFKHSLLLAGAIVVLLPFLFDAIVFL